jgi:hypothetical protein
MSKDDGHYPECMDWGKEFGQLGHTYACLCDVCHLDMGKLRAEREGLEKKLLSISGLIGNYPGSEAKPSDEEWSPTFDQVAAILKERDAYKRDFDDELSGSMALRIKHCARPDETFPAFVDRIVSERDALAKRLEMVKELTRAGDGLRLCLNPQCEISPCYNGAIIAWDMALAAWEKCK